MRLQTMLARVRSGMTYRPLSHALIGQILDYLDCPAQAPALRYLNRLIRMYIRRVPWESVSRIVKRHTTMRTRDCPRWPDEFWQDAMQQGFGGTCYESSLAFFDLLLELGYHGYLTVNDMGEHRGCHAAIVVLLDQRKYLVDVTIPVPVAVPIDGHRLRGSQTALQNYTIRLVGDNRYDVTRSGRAGRYAFTLVDLPVALPDYLTILEKDYTASGHFLKSVVIVKVIDNRTHRYFSDRQPYKITIADHHGKDEIILQPEALAQALARLFDLPADRVSEALSYTESTSRCGLPSRR